MQNFAPCLQRIALNVLSCLCYAVLSVPYCLLITCLERADLLALLCVVFTCSFVTFPYGVLGQLWFLIVMIPDLCLPLYFDVLIGCHSNVNFKQCLIFYLFNMFY